MHWQRTESCRPAPWIAWTGGLLLLVLVSSCATTKPASQAESETSPEASDPVSPAEALAVDEKASEEPAVPADRQEVEKPDPTTIYIDTGDSEDPKTRSLVEASKAERVRRAKAHGPVTVITNKTLPQYSKGKVTFSETKGTRPKPGVHSPGTEQGEEYWRKRGLDIRTRWRESAELVKQLELDTAGWRRRFYAENNSSIRDQQIKPEWDRNLDQLRQARIAVEAARKELVTFLEEGRAAAALPGWLREGVEIEPPPTPAMPSPTEAIEPPILELDGTP